VESVQFWICANFWQQGAEHLTLLLHSPHNSSCHHPLRAVLAFASTMGNLINSIVSETTGMNPPTVGRSCGVLCVCGDIGH